MNSTMHNFSHDFYPAAFLRTFVWSIGEVDWEGTTKEEESNATNTVLGYITLLIFIFFFVLVMTNLLNALAIGDITVRSRNRAFHWATTSFC